MKKSVEHWWKDTDSGNWSTERNCRSVTYFDTNPTLDDLWSNPGLCCEMQTGWPCYTITLTESFLFFSLCTAHVWSGISLLKDNKWNVFPEISPLQPNEFLSKCFSENCLLHTKWLSVNIHEDIINLYDFRTFLSFCYITSLVSTRHAWGRPVVGDHELVSSRVTLFATRPSSVIIIAGLNKRISVHETWRLCLTDQGFTKQLHNHEIIVTQIL
jgi:hypothetical protein